MGVNTTFVGADGVGVPELIEIGKKATEGFIYTDHFNEAAVESPKAKAYVEAFHKKYSRAADSMGALAADAYGMIINAMDQCIDEGKESDDKECINNKLRNTKEYHGITGTITINEKGDAVKSAVVNIVKDGAFSYITTVKP